MSTLSNWRQSARALLPGDCFLRRDQQLRALFVTDFPRRHPDLTAETLHSMQSAGFEITEEKGLWLIDLCPQAQFAFISSLPEPRIRNDLPLEIQSLCRSLLSQGITPAHLQPWKAVKRALLRLDAGEEALLIPELRAILAQYKRQKTALPTAIVSLFNEEGKTC
ncbi:MAG: hypothetical protein IJA59_04615 [Clostridia bacterium]|nr:hypothetical protein [Clostridia bacterium]